ncbi:unnamed protein product [Leptosia nina]|uniref:Uncharacterized protein n=1 Tax=Leptosia nina TaxID=320188 RepID=A0AAV1J3C8_9NEOP
MDPSSRKTGHGKLNHRSVSDHNVFFAYVCLVNDVEPTDGNELETSQLSDDEVLNDRPIQVERSRALHELVEVKKRDMPIDSNMAYAETTENVELQYIREEPEDPRNHANILKFTKMKWLTEGQEGSPESSSPSISPSVSSASTCSRESEEAIDCRVSVGDKCLSTILRLDKEHNMFGLSNIAIIGTKTSKRNRKDKPAFPQTAIVQICCGRGCCRHKASPCTPSKCMLDCSNCFGMKISVKRKPKYDPAPPLAARSCHHLPHCVPPSSCFPYLMPCYWPSRAGAPCNDPSRCFHTPPCRAPRKRKAPKSPDEICPKNIPVMKKAIESRFGNK